MTQTARKSGEKLSAIRLSADEQARIAHLAEIKQRKPHWIMKEALRQYLDREDEAEKLRQETLASWDDYARTGMHVSEDAMNSWLDTWGSVSEAEPPKCRS